MSIIGIDPSTRNTGWAIFKDGNPVHWGCECSTYDDRLEATQQIALRLEQKFIDLRVIGERAEEFAHIFIEAPDPWLKKVQAADSDDVPFSRDQVVPVFRPPIGGDMTVARYGELWMAVGVLAEHLWRPYCAQVQVRLVPTRIWKGYEKKLETQQRLESEFEIRTGTPHEADAIMLGFWAYHTHPDLK